MINHPLFTIETPVILSRTKNGWKNTVLTIHTGWYEAQKWQTLVKSSERCFQVAFFFFFFKFNIPPSTCHTRTSFVENWKILCHRYNTFNGEVKSMTLAERLHFWKVTTYNILGCNTEAWIKGIYSNQEAGVPTNYSCVSLAQGSSKSYRYL